MNTSDLKILVQLRLPSVMVMAMLCGPLFGGPAGSAQQPPVPVVVTAAMERQVASGQMFVATVMPIKRAVIGSAVEGRVHQRFIEVGELVQQGEPLVQLLTETIQLELKAAQAELELRKFELEEMENGARPFEIEQAQARMLAAEANATFSRLKRDRIRRLTDSKAIPQVEFDEAVAAFDQTAQTYLDLKAAYQLISEGLRPEQIAQARSRLAIQQAIVEQIEDRIQKYTISSRFDGYVVALMVEIGTWVKTGDPILEVIQLDEVELQTYVGEQHVRHVRLGEQVRVEVPSLPGRPIIGTVRAVVPQADRQARTFPVLVRVLNEINEAGPVLRPGKSARVELPTGSTEIAVLVPKDALVLGGPTTVVFVVNSMVDGTAQVMPVNVELGIASGDWIQVKGPLVAGQRVVVEGNERLRPGQEVLVRERP